MISGLTRSGKMAGGSSKNISVPIKQVSVIPYAGERRAGSHAHDRYPCLKDSLFP